MTQKYCERMAQGLKIDAMFSVYPNYVTLDILSVLSIFSHPSQIIHDLRVQ